MSCGIYLLGLRNRQVRVSLVSEAVVTGKLIAFDENLNLVMSEVAHRGANGWKREHTDLFIRGSSVRYITE